MPALALKCARELTVLRAFKIVFFTVKERILKIVTLFPFKIHGGERERERVSDDVIETMAMF